MTALAILLVLGKPVDFDAIERTIVKKPECNRPLYGLFLFGDERVWALLDRSDPASGVYDRLYFDRNADGDLTGKDERFEAKSASKKRAVFDIGDFVDPATGAKHTKFTLTYTDKSVFFSMRWRGKHVTMGAYGPSRDTYAQFAPTAADAPVFVPGFDRPLEFEHWMSGTLRRGAVRDFKVFVGRRGSKRGAFCSSDDRFLPAGEYVKATLIYTATDGTRKRYEAKLTERC